MINCRSFELFSLQYIGLKLNQRKHFVISFSHICLMDATGKQRSLVETEP